MGKSLIFKDDLEDEGRTLEVFATNDETVRIYITAEDQYGTSWMDFNKEGAKEFIKEMNRQIKLLS